MIPMMRIDGNNGRENDMRGGMEMKSDDGEKFIQKKLDHPTSGELNGVNNSTAAPIQKIDSEGKELLLTSSSVASKNGEKEIANKLVVGTNKDPQDEENNNIDGMINNLNERKSKDRITSNSATHLQSRKRIKPTSTNKTETSQHVVDKNDMAWICAECKEAECVIDSIGYGFIICDGKCNRLFHLPCAGLVQPPESDDAWICRDCTSQRHQCSICQEYGVVDEDVFCCRRDSCGLYFHESCLLMNNVEVKMLPRDHSFLENSNKGIAQNNNKSIDGTPTDGTIFTEGVVNPTTDNFVPDFVCPAHHCWTCTQNVKPDDNEGGSQELTNPRRKGRSNKRKSRILKEYMAKPDIRLFKCIECPRAYHLSCIPPLSRFHEIALLCHEHAATHKLPDLELETSMQLSLEDKVDRRLMQIGNNQSRLAKQKNNYHSYPNPFLPGVVADKLVRDEISFFGKLDPEKAEQIDLGFCLPCDVMSEVHSKPPSYKHIHTLRYQLDKRPKKVSPPDEVCQCERRCGDDCLNRASMVECFGDDKQVSKNCNLGDGCGNRSLGQRIYAKCKPKREEGKGWGLVTLDRIEKGTLVHEYLGEVIDEQTKDERLREWSKEHPNDPNFYIMSLSAGWYIDARIMANLSRFINHSCSPNCQIVTVNVKGSLRIGIYSLRDIQADEFLSYDYHFDTRDGDKFICRCGAEKCRGTMKQGKSQKDDMKPLNWDEAKAKYDVDQKYMEEYYHDLSKRRSQVGALVPAAELERELVSGGPQERYRGGKTFLFRNAVVGADLERRDTRVRHRRQTFLMPGSNAITNDKL